MERVIQMKEKCKLKLTTCWLNINRCCNLRCEWCYAKNTGFDPYSNISLDDAKKTINLIAEIGINSVILIGGEPTLHPFLCEIIRYAKDKSMVVSIVSNGLKFTDMDFLQKVKDSGLDFINLSLKGENQNQFQNITGVDAFNEVMNAIKNISKSGIEFNVAMVLTLKNIHSFLNGIKEAKRYGCNFFDLSFCYNLNLDDNNKIFLEENNPKKIIEEFSKIYDELNNITNGKFALEQSFPLCLWNNNDVIQKMIERKQINTLCQLLQRQGLILDEELNVIPCNVLHMLKLGNIKGFTNGNEILNLVRKSERIYNRLTAVPSKKCVSCKDYISCGGGCPVQWTNYSFKELFNKL